ncbi:MAG TPA: type II toxin-antitoxin system HipA family toxin [bacterium]|nr:type II toxin-antitoxin system HipA family toxin [bacterium]HQN72246.1 type II toxin-antitoxin system HipA family toxin [bacterium]
MVNIAKVNIWGNFAGAVVWNEGSGGASFEFERDFVRKGFDLSPLKMPIAEAENGTVFSFPFLNPETFKGLPGLLADSLPDRFGNKVIDAWLAANGRTSESMNPIERLCYIGKRGMGALEFEPAVMTEKSNPVEVEDLVKLAQEILSSRKDFEADLSDKGVHEIFRVGTSAGGARAKAIIAYNPSTGAVRSGQIDGLTGFEYWIIKFDGVNDSLLLETKGYGNIEYAYYLMALDCGIEMSECKLLHENGRSHFMTKRFDRTGLDKIHMQTLCAIAHFDYNDPRSYAYEQVFQVMRELRLPYADAEQMFRRMVFNIMAENRDDHTKNISFLMDKTGKWQLSPAYDMTYAFDPANKWIGAHQLSVNGKRTEIKKEDMLEVATKMNIKKPLEIIEQVEDSIGRWNEFAKIAEVGKDFMEKFKILFL